MKFLALSLLSLVIASCASNQTAEVRPVPPRSSDDPDNMPWNNPSQGVAPGGAFGGMLEGR